MCAVFYTVAEKSFDLESETLVRSIRKWLLGYGKSTSMVAAKSIFAPRTF